MYLLERQNVVETEIVVDLDDPDDVSKSKQEKEFGTLLPVSEKKPLLSDPPLKQKVIN